MSTAAAAEVERLGEQLLRAAALLPVEQRAVALERQITRLQAAQTQALIDAERSGELADSGRKTVRSFTAGILRRSQAEASQVAQVAEHLDSFPKLAAAYRDGTAHTANLRAVMAHIRSCGLQALQDHEDALLVLATEAGPHEIYTFCRLLADATQPDRDQEAVEAEGGRMVKIARVGDLAHLDAMLDPVVASRLKATLAALAKAARTPDDKRSYTERSADALERVLQRGMDGIDLPDQARRRPTALVHLPLQTLLGLPGRGEALLERFGVIPAGTAARVACDALVRLVVTDGHRVLNVGRAQRVVSDRQHAALAAIYPTCVAPGCRVPFADCEIHHLWWWSRGGPTDLDLQLPLCKADHIAVHEHELRITREQGVLIFRNPRGLVITNPTDVLTTQLDLLAVAADGAPQPSTQSDPADLQVPQSRYDHGTWGWTGEDPLSPPGHDPPQSDTAA
ncbi:MAG: HNH endonuclease [Actinomycetota bacterium]|nr:HNH endonuclease [Actinomycetota bacterium]